MPEWNGKYQATIRRHNGGDWVHRRRCFAVTKGSGGGYSGSHQCTSSVYAEFQGWPLCYQHLKQRLEQDNVV